MRHWPLDELNLELKQSDMKQLSEYREYLNTHPRLVFLFLEMTSRCNLRCLHCGSNCGENGEKSPLSKNDYISFFSDLIKSFDPNDIMLCVTGGEPLLRNDVFDIMSYAVSLGFSWGMTTNGTLINPDIIKKMHASDMKTISVSIDGLSEMHDWLRNRQGCFQQAINGIKLLVDAKCFSHVQVTTVVHKKNLDQLDEMYKLIKELGCRSWRLINIDPIGRANLNQELFLDSQDFRKLFNFIRTKREDQSGGLEVTYGCAHYLMLEYERELRDYYFICGSGIYVASILVNGDIYSCLDIERRPELIQGNILKDNFEDVWKKGFQAFRNDRYMLSKKCGDCLDNMYCRGDSAHTWDYNKNEPVICMKEMLS
jgi:radical SAM protein with 4Fe4S-binding SPASM domain